MAKVTHEKPLSRRVVVKTRGFIVHKNYKGKRPYVQKWPKRRGPSKKPQVRVWIEHFAKWSNWSKAPDPCAVATAKDLVPGTGYWTRDVIHRAGSGKINHHRPNVPLSSPLPYLFLHPPSKRYEGPPQVITPTTNVKRNSGEALVMDTFKTLTPDAKVWDNNAFWDMTTHPERLTFRSDGIYLVMCQVHYTQRPAYDINLTIHHSDGNQDIVTVELGTPIYPPVINCIGIVHAYAGEYVELVTVVHQTGVSAQIERFQIVAITPEGII